MPIYMFKCQSCKTSYELFLKFSNADEVQTCSKCGSELSKEVSKSNFYVSGDSAKNNYGLKKN